MKELVESKSLDSLCEQMKNDENLANNLAFENTKKINIVIREFCEKFIAFSHMKMLNPAVSSEYRRWQH